MVKQPTLGFQMSYNDYDSDDGESNLEYSEDEYNSEDDEFLAFHDADIEAQVDREPWYCWLLWRWLSMSWLRFELR